MARGTRAVAALALILASVAAAQGVKEAGGTVSEPKTALLVIDVQNFYFPGGRLALDGPEEASLKARAALARFRALHWPVIHVQHLPEGVATPDPNIANEAYRIHPNVVPLPGEALIGKHQANSFRDTPLLGTLRALDVRRVVICGMQTHMCVEATARAAADFGFEVVVLSDACATRALSFGGVDVPARQVHAATLASLANMYGRVVTTEEFLAGLPSPTAQ